MMGDIAEAKCQCGFASEHLFLGNGMSGPEPCYFVHICMKCPTLFEASILENRIVCPKCDSEDTVPCDDPRLCKTPGNEIFFWRMDGQRQDLRLTDGDYLCPGCGKFTLKFYVVGCWD